MRVDPTDLNEMERLNKCADCCLVIGCDTCGPCSEHDGEIYGKTSDTPRMDVAEFAQLHNITATVRPDPVKLHGRSFRVTLHFDGRQMTVPFFQGSAWITDPTVAEVLNCLALDSAGYENADGFFDWCDECGFDIENDNGKSAQTTWLAVMVQHDKLTTLLGSELLSQLLWETDNL